MAATNSGLTIDAGTLKSEVREHWERETCGVRYAGADDRAQWFDEVSRARASLEPYIAPFADFPSAAGKQVLEIGVGAGADFERWCQHADRATGVDLTEAAIRLTGERVQLRDVPRDRYELRTADAEALPFSDASFDLVWSWGVLHHTPRTELAFAEVLRVLRPGGRFRGMVYHDRSWTGLMLAGEDALRRRTPRMSIRRAVAARLESPGTKVYSEREAKIMLSSVGFTDVRASTKLSPGDLLTIRPSERYQGRVMKLAWRLYPRPVVRAFGDRFGLNLLLEATKPTGH